MQIRPAWFAQVNTQSHLYEQFKGKTKCVHTAWSPVVFFRGEKAVSKCEFLENSLFQATRGQIKKTPLKEQNSQNLSTIWVASCTWALQELNYQTAGIPTAGKHSEFLILVWLWWERQVAAVLTVPSALSVNFNIDSARLRRKKRSWGSLHAEDSKHEL